MQEIPIVLIGHKDHGKSTLIGRLILDTGSVKQSRVKEIKEVDESFGQKFELAHLVDAFKEERDREMTMDTTRALLKGKERNYQLIDVPGHGELIANMLTGAAGAEGALLMVSIEEGIKEQTREHLEVAKLLGIEQLGVVVNKIDKTGYQKEAFDSLAGKLRPMLEEIGYKDVRFFPVSAWEGDNVVRKSDKTPWYQGPTVMEFLENEIRIPPSFENLPLSFLVQDSYDNVLVGKVESGILEKGKEVLILPANKKTIIRSIKDSEKELERAQAGQNLGIEISEDNIGRGVVISDFNSDLKVGNILSGEVFWIKEPSQENLILECGTARAGGRLLEKKKDTYQISTERPVVFQPRGKTILGKIVLKEQGKIIGVGNIHPVRN